MVTSCNEKTTLGYLEVNAPSYGSYEIYKFELGANRSLVSEQSGVFNEKIPLAPGNYLVLADCSSESIIIHPHKTKSLTAHQVDFTPPFIPHAGDSFSIQCSRSNDIKSRQQFSNKYSFNVLHGNRDLLVSLVPFNINSNLFEDPQVPQKISYQLSAVQVEQFADGKATNSYFISPLNELVSVTKSLQLGNWEFLLPGKYTLELNGTELPIVIGDNESKVVKPASIEVETSQNTDLSKAADIQGAPQLVEINEGHWLNFNETYPILPGTFVVQIKGSARQVTYEITEGEKKVFQTKSVIINQGCSPWEWTCLGQRDVMLYEDGHAYPFVENVTDVPVLYIDDGAPIWVGVGGSRDIRYKLPEKAKSKSLNVGYINLIPIPELRPGQRTDLMRVEANKLPFEGVSLDLNLEKPTKMPLIGGWYYLSHYVSLSISEGERRLSKRGFKVVPGETIDIEFKVFFSEKRMKQYSAKNPPLRKVAGSGGNGDPDLVRFKAL